MKKITSLLAIFLLAINLSTAQEKTLEDSYQQYFKLPREALFIHTNKTTYLTGEEVWLKTYAFDRKNSLPSKKTTNIYVGLYDSIGNQIDKKLFLANEGAAKGNIKLDTLLASGTYYLKANTNWMKNFKEHNSFVQKIEVINSKQPRGNKVNNTKFDLQFLPEGGHLVAGVKNTVGLKFLNDEGKGSFISGKIYNQNDELITTFKSNALGMGKFTLTPALNESYKATFELYGGDKESVDLPSSKERGIAMSVNNLRKDKVLVNFYTNKSSLSNLPEGNYKLIIHRDGLLKSIAFKMDGEIKLIPIPKEELFSGVNILTLVNPNNEPILERIIFNDMALRKLPLAVKEVSSDFDSINYAVRSIKSLGENEKVSLSISVLPGETKAYRPNHSILSAFLIEPYIQGTIENPNFYFKNFGLKDKYELDILMLNQGWSRYSWQDVVKGQPKPIYDFENGISVNGNINSSLRNIKSFILYPTKYSGTKFIDADKKGKFSFNNFFVEKGEKISFSSLMSNGKMKRPLINLSPIITQGKDKLEASLLNDNFISYYTNKNEIPTNFILDGYEKLDEVNIVVKKKERLRDPQFPNAQITQITQNIARQYPNITDYLQNNGFNVVDGTTSGVFIGQIRIESRGRGGNASPVLFVDNILIQDFNILQTMTMDKIDKILIDRSGIGLGISGGNAFGGVIKITTRNTSLFNPNATTPDIFATKINYGFEPVKEFYAPKYPSYRIQSFKDYGVIHWVSDASLSGLKDFKFRTINTELDEINFFIEGISSEGTLFSQVIKLNSNNKDK